MLPEPTSAEQKLNIVTKLTRILGCDDMNLAGIPFWEIIVY